MHVLNLIKRSPAVVAVVVVTAIVVAGLLASGGNQDGKARPAMGKADRGDVDRILNEWTPGPRLAGQEMIAKYGPPQEVTADRMIWQNKGPYKRILLTREELPHDFPLTHMDYLEHTISYEVPLDKTDEVHAFDASITIYRVGGELSARCDLESNNVLTLNLANDIITGKKGVEEARKEFGQAVADRTLGKPPANTKDLLFKPMDAHTAADREKTTIPGSPQRGPRASEKTGPGTEGHTPTGDAEIMALVIALDENEVHAAMTAEEKKIGDPVMGYARTLHQEHGKDISDTQQLGIKIGVTPLESQASEQLHAKGAEQLAKLVPLSGADFSRAFVAAMDAGHRDALQMLEQWQKMAKNDALKQHLTAVRQHVEMHLKEAGKLHGSSG